MAERRRGENVGSKNFFAAASLCFAFLFLLLYDLQRKVRKWVTRRTEALG
jgi:hypothetical protein